MYFVKQNKQLLKIFIQLYDSCYLLTNVFHLTDSIYHLIKPLYLETSDRKQQFSIQISIQMLKLFCCCCFYSWWILILNLLSVLIRILLEFSKQGARKPTQSNLCLIEVVPYLSTIYSLFLRSYYYSLWMSVFPSLPIGAKPNTVFQIYAVQFENIKIIT